MSGNCAAYVVSTKSHNAAPLCLALQFIDAIVRCGFYVRLPDVHETEHREDTVRIGYPGVGVAQCKNPPTVRVLLFH